MKKIICLILLTLVIEVGILTSYNVKLSGKIVFEGYKNVHSLSVDKDLNDEIISSSDEVRVDVIYYSDFAYNLGDYYQIKPEEVDDIKSKRIAAGKEYHTKLNKTNSEKLPNYDYHDIYLSSYFPVISLALDAKEMAENKYEIF